MQLPITLLPEGFKVGIFADDDLLCCETKMGYMSKWESISAILGIVVGILWSEVRRDMKQAWQP
jgi:hypothetical protein